MVEDETQTATIIAALMVRMILVAVVLSSDIVDAYTSIYMYTCIV